MAKERGASPRSSLDVPTAGRDIAKLKKSGEFQKVRRSVSRAKKTQCPRATVPAFIYSTQTSKSFEVPCGSYSCPWCSWRKMQVCQFYVLAGMIEAHNRGDRLRFATLTEDPKKPLDVPQLSKAWNRLRTNLKDLGLLDEYISCVEVTKKSRPHLHLVLTGKFIPQRKLSQLAEKAGFGRVADIRAVEMDPEKDGKSAAGYIAKEISGYLSKTKTEGLGKLVATRRRPLRASRGWYPGGMKRAEKELLSSFLDDLEEGEKDNGPFFFVIGDPAGTLSIRGTGPSGETFRVRDRGGLTVEEEGATEASASRAKGATDDETEEPPRWSEAA